MSNQPPASLFPPGRVEEEAATWFARLRGDTLSASERARFAEWLAADPAHRQVYAALESLWNESGELPPAHQPRRRFLNASLSVAGLALAAALFALSPRGETLETGTGERQHLRLADGSELDLAPQSRLRVEFDDNRRTLVLAEGRVVIRVAADRARPFEVHSKAGRIRDIGTRFEVDATRERTRVQVAEGQVEILTADNAQTRRLAAGEATEFSGREIEPSRQVDPEASLAWTRGQLIIDSLPLSELLDELNRYRKARIVLRSPELALRRVSGSFLLDDEEGTLRALASILPLRVTTENGKVYLKAK